jgi:nicotinamide-nucleotide amidase
VEVTGTSPVDATDRHGRATGGAAEVVRELAERRASLAVVESLTGGLLAATIVDVPGASRVFRGALVAYATELKASLVGVPAPLLAARGAVDPDVAVALAEGGRRRCDADWCLSTTGVAGPQPQDGKPVGLVFVAAAGPSGTVVRRLELDGDRRRIRTATVEAALRLLTDRLRAGPAPGAGG